MSHGKLESLITIPASFSFTLTDSTGGASDLLTFTADKTYYWSSAGNDTVDLAAKMKALLDSVSNNTYTVTIDATEDGTGAVTISVDDGLFTIVWSNTAVGALFGFTSSISGKSSATGTHVKGLWLPDCPYESPFGADDSGWVEYDGSSTQSPDGTVVSTAYNSRTANALTWAVCNANKVRTTAETSANESYQTFYNDCVFGSASWATCGGPVRWYRSASTDGTYVTYKQPIDRVLRPPRVLQDFSGYYTVEIPRLVKVP